MFDHHQACLTVLVGCGRTMHFSIRYSTAKPQASGGNQQRSSVLGVGIHLQFEIPNGNRTPEVENLPGKVDLLILLSLASMTVGQTGD